MTASRPDLTLLVPCFNEGARVERLLGAVGAWSRSHSDLDVECLCVDDGSTDDTRRRLAQATCDPAVLQVVTLERNAGKGQALSVGMAAAQGRVVLFLDADLAVDLSHVDPALALVSAGADVVVGCRNVPGAAVRRRQGRMRRWLGRGYRKLACWILGLDVSDVTCGFKAFRRDVGQMLFDRAACKRWGFDAEILFLAQRGGYDIREMPVQWFHGDVSAVRLGRDVFGALRELFSVRLRHAFTSVPRLLEPAGEPVASAPAQKP